jgi:aromatase
MKVLQHQVQIAADPDAAFALCRDVERWPDVFPPCQAAKVLEHDGSRQLIEISALANGELLTWRSRRELHEEARVITFEQVAPAPLVDRMEGAWRFFPVDRGTLVALEHRLSVKDEVEGLVPGVETADDALSFITCSTDENSRRELREMKRILEAAPGSDDDGGARAGFEEELLVPAPPGEVFDLLRDAAGWPRLLPHCEDIAMRYDDGVDQEFVMSIEAGGEDEVIRTVRHCIAPWRISYFQPEPPPALALHRGDWLIEPQDGGCLVVSRHEIELAPEGVRRLWGDLDLREARGRVIDAINANSRATMVAVRDALASGVSA